MGFCRRCGNPVSRAVPQGDDSLRDVCTNCGHIEYDSPTVLATCMVHEGDRVLWIRRAQAPDRGKWAIPGGFVECGENLQEAASRELFEETGVQVEPWSLQLYGIGSLPHIAQVYVTFHVALAGQQFRTTPEASEVSLFAAGELDWEEVAYPDINFHVRRFYGEICRGDYGIYLGEVNGERGVRVVECGRAHGEPTMIHDFSEPFG